MCVTVFERRSHLGRPRPSDYDDDVDIGDDGDCEVDDDDDEDEWNVRPPVGRPQRLLVSCWQL